MAKKQLPPSIDLNSIFTFGQNTYKGTSSSPLLLPSSSDIALLDDDTAGKMELGLEKIIDDLIGRGTNIPPDLKVDDRDFKEFPNFYDFCTSSIGMDTAPFARQFELGVKLFSEYCPRCTRKRTDPLNRKAKVFHFERHYSLPVDMLAEDALDHVQLLEHGVCPRCKANRAEMFATGELNIYRELAACIGQRAGKSKTLSLYIPYIIHRYLKAQSPTAALGLLKNEVLTGTLVALTFAKALGLLFVPIANALRGSEWFCVEENELITMWDGSTKPICEVNVGDTIKTLEGVANVLETHDNGIKEVFEIELEDGKILRATADHKVRCLIDGNLEWIEIKNLTEEHYLVVE